jgi:hypothetical protein
MDKVLVDYSFAKCYINDIIVFNLTLEDHMHHLHEVFAKLKNHNLMFHLDKCRFFHTHVEHLSHMIYPSRLGVQKALLGFMVYQTIQLDQIFLFD